MSTPSARRGSTGSARHRLVVLALVLVTAAGASACTVGADGAQEPDEAAASSAAPATSVPPASPAVAAQRVGGVTPEPPVSLTLPTGRRVHVRSVSTTSNGVLDVPAEIRDAGWWRGGSRIGDPFGSTLLAAHVDSTTEGLGPFASLLSVRPGDTVTVRSRTLEQTYRIRSRWLRPRGTLGARSWLHSPVGPRRLTLVTCAAPYVPSQGGYQNLAVIIADPVGDPVTKAAR